MVASKPDVVAYYFGYGSNLWLEQMAMRCPHSTFVGIAKLQDFRWMINHRGYANVVEHSPPAATDQTWHVWGMVYTLTSSDMQRLDRNEGVPHAYTKEWHLVDFWRNDTNSLTSAINIEMPPAKKEMLVYIDRRRIMDDTPQEEYIYRMNMGIADALNVGIPSSYVDEVMRKYIPPMKEIPLTEQVLKKAGKQALEFVDDASSGRVGL
jgi:gamma-glutamylcyclotransferase